MSSSKIDAAEQVVVLDNGCMCCTVRGDLLGAFESINKKIAEGNSIDSVLIETTGLANPVPIVSTAVKNNVQFVLIVGEDDWNAFHCKWV